MTEPVASPPPPSPVFYPESDGEPMSDNTRQLRWIVTLYGNLAALFRDNPNVFVGGNQFWYPVEGEPEVKQSPDVYVVFGRPKGERPSYKQWEEGNLPMTVVFEILSPKNTRPEMAEKLSFYEEHGAQEYYEYDPDRHSLLIYVRKGDVFRRVWQTAGFVSPRLGIRFDMSGEELLVYYPDGQRFLTFEELKAEQEREHQERLAAQRQAEQERQQRFAAEQRAGAAEQRVGAAEQRAVQEHQERLAAEQRAGEAEQHAAQERQQRLEAEQRVARLVELGRKARRQQATPEELAELERLEEQGPSS